MNIFDVIGPAMIGPSSSHTAGAVRLSLLAISILGAWPVKAQIALHGSFAQTYRGHGTDMALLAGLMGWLPDDARIPQAMDFAQKQCLEYEFSTINLGDLTHPNTVYFKLTAADGRQCEVIGSSIGGGQVLVTSIDGAAVELSGKLPAILTLHKDKPGVISLVSSALASAGINIAGMRVFRANKGGLATMVIECDQVVPEPIINLVAALEPMQSVRFIRNVL